MPENGKGKEGRRAAPDHQKNKNGDQINGPGINGLDVCLSRSSCHRQRSATETKKGRKIKQKLTKSIFQQI